MWGQYFCNIHSVGVFANKFKSSPNDAYDKPHILRIECNQWTMQIWWVAVLCRNVFWNDCHQISVDQSYLSCFTLPWILLLRARINLMRLTNRCLMALSGLFLILEVFYSCRGIKLLPDKSLPKSGSIPIFSKFALKIGHSPIVFICPQSVSHANLLWKKHLKSIRARLLLFISRDSWISR